MLTTAFKFLRYEKAKSMGILLAIVISIYLIGLQLGLFFYLSSLIGGVINNANPDYAKVFVVNKRTNNVNLLAPFDMRWVNQLRSVPGVSGTYGMVMGNVSIRFPNGDNAPGVLIGSDFPHLAAGPTAAMIHSGDRHSLTNPATVSTDFYDNRTFGYDLQLGSTFEINGKTATVGAMTKNAKGFTSPMLYTTTSKARSYTRMSPYHVNGVIVDVDDETQVDAVVDAINRIAPDLRAWRAEDLKQSTILNVMTANNMGMSFGTLVLFAIVSGFFIIGLTLYSATYDRIKDYGTLKAIGATNGYITRLVVTQSFIYSVIGFIISVILIVFTKMGMAKAGLIIKLTPLFLLFLFLVTLLIAVGSSFFSTGKLKKVEPSSVFR